MTKTKNCFLCLDQLIAPMNGIQILQQKGRMVKVTFDKSIVSYQYIEEGYTMYILAMLSKKYGEDFLDWSLFTIKHSPYFDYISSLSKIPLDPEKYTHYVFFCVDELFEVIADHEPTFELID